MLSQNTENSKDSAQLNTESLWILKPNIFPGILHLDKVMQRNTS